MLKRISCETKLKNKGKVTENAARAEGVAWVWAADTLCGDVSRID